MATNSLSGVNSARISQLTLDALQTLKLPLSAFTTEFSDEIATVGESVTTRFVTNPTVADFDSLTRAAQNSATTARTITLNKYVGVDIGFTDRQESLSDIRLMEMYIQPAITALFENVMATILPQVTSANFTANTLITAANFSYSNVVGVVQALNTAKAPLTPRHLIVPPTYAATLKKDAAVSAAYAYGTNEVVARGTLPVVAGLQIHEWNGTIPSNSENLAGIALHPQALLLAARAPQTPRNWAGQVYNITDPDSGLTIQFRDYYDGVLQRTQFCLLFGVQIGVGGNLHRIRSA
jgi:hypothetical protein